MSQNNNPDQLWLMLGEIRGDLKYLVAERQRTHVRMDGIEEQITAKIEDHAERLTRLEAFKIRIGILAAFLGMLVPTAITIAARYMGWL